MDQRFGASTIQGNVLSNEGTLSAPSPQNAKCVRGAEETVPSEDADRSRSSPIFHAVTLGAPSACPGCSAGPTSPDCAGLWRRMSGIPVTPNCFFSPFSSCVSGLLPFLVPHLLPHSVCFVEMERAGGCFRSGTWFQRPPLTRRML